MNNSWLKARQTKFALYATVYTLIVVAVVGTVNFLANRYNKTYDATKSKKFTLSDQTLKIAKNLKQDVTITYWDKATNFQGAHDLLDRYKNLSPKIDVQYQDVDKKKTAAIAAGVKSYGTVFVNVGSKQQEAKSLSEEEITGALVRAMKGGERTVCFVLGAGEHALDDSGRDGASRAKELLEKNNYKTQTVKLLQKPDVPAECTILVVDGPKRDYTAPEVAAMKNYVENGGRALFMLDPPLNFAQMQIDANPGLTDVLAAWGVTLDKDLVIDASGVGQIFGLGGEVPLVVSYESHAIVREMKETPTAFPIARSIEVKNGDKTTVEKLFATGEESFGTMNLNSPEIRASKTDKKGPLTLAGAGTYNTGKESGNGRFVVVGNAGWSSNGFISFRGNRDLFMNIMNWLSSDEDLISIRPKEPTDSRLNMTSRQMTMVEYFSVFFIPLMIVFAGVGVWWKRR
ncbi:MAG TPA: GldG family protein [Bryobacteraceae bacterium]|nr:GldG family protein [Bryobacteraceae bacterium]